MKLIVQIPCYNEEQTIAQTIADIPREIPGIETVEVLIIDDGCVDDTVANARAAGAEHVLSFAGNKGLAAGFSAGLHRAVELGADIVVNTDADNQYRGDCIPDLVRPVVEGRAEIVVGRRPIEDHPEFSWSKKKLQRLGSWVVSQVSQTEVSDATSGFRAYSREAAQRLTVISGFTYTHETLIQAGRSNMTVTEVPIQVNRQTRPSRLFKSIPQYIRKSVMTILRIYTLYQPMTLFFIIGSVFMLVALTIGGRFLYYYLGGNGSGHIQSLLLGAVLGIVAVQIWVVGIVADLIAANRKIMQEILYQTRRSTNPMEQPLSAHRREAFEE
jgi:glycosyltransferase involved in cell wall biosynthesis